MARVVPFGRRRLPWGPHGRVRSRGLAPRDLILSGMVFLAVAFFSSLLLTPERPGVEASARFAICSGPVRVTCVVDGDTIWFHGTKIRIADINTPEVSSPACAREAQLGRLATARLRQLLNDGPFEIVPSGARDEDVYGRKLRVLNRGGRSLGAILVAEGLAERWTGSRRNWC